MDVVVLTEKTAEVAPAATDKAEVVEPIWTAGYWTSITSRDAPPTNPATAEDYPKLGGLSGAAAAVDNYFRVKDRGSTFWMEFTGGMTTFFSMCYIMVLNGVILNASTSYGTGMSTNGAFFATALASGIFTIIMGLVANAPIALAPGMGLNGYFATIVGAGGAAIAGSKLDLQNALGAVFLSGVIYSFLTLTGLRTAIFTAIPSWMRAAIACGVGFFICMIGLKIGQIEQVSVASWYWGQSWASASPVNFAAVTNSIATFSTNGVARMSVLGLAFLGFFTTLRVPGAVIISIILTTFAAINAGTGKVFLADSSVSGNAVTDLTLGNWYAGAAWHWLPSISYAGLYSTSQPNAIPSGILRFDLANTPLFWEAVWTFLAVEMFDSFGTITACVARANANVKGAKNNALINRAMLVDGFGLMLGSVIGSNSITCYIESLTGIESGARTGFASFVTGSAFLLSLLFVRPFVEIIPDAATCCALVWVGVCSLKSLREIDWDSPVQLFCTFLTVSIMGFTYSIFNGITFGFIAFSLIQITLWVAQKIADKNTHYGSILLSAAGVALVAAGALGPWAWSESSKTGFSLYSTTVNSVKTYGTPTGQTAAALALLLIGFIVGFVHFLTVVLKGKVTVPDAAPKVLAGLAFVCSLVGLIVAGADYYTSPYGVYATLSRASGGNDVQSPAFGCAVAGVIAQGIALLFVFDEKAAALFKPAAGTDTSLPHPLMVVISIFFVFRYRYLGA